MQAFRVRDFGRSAPAPGMIFTFIEAGAREVLPLHTRLWPIEQLRSQL